MPRFFIHSRFLYFWMLINKGNKIFEESIGEIIRFHEDKVLPAS
jgi:hypothetical protein